MDRLAAMRVFLAVIESGGFTAAARRLKLPLATVSRQVASLERELGARLLARNTRNVAATEAGRVLAERAKRILDEMAEAESLVAGDAQTLAGRIVVSAPILLGHHFLVGIVADFMAAHPRVEIDLWLDDRFVDLVAEGIDVALRVGPLADSSLVVRRLGGFKHRLVASPAYLAAHGTPRRPEDLARHECILSVRQIEGARWKLARGGEERVVPVRGRLRTDEAEAIIRAAAAGLGIGRAPDWLVAGALDSGKLAEVLPAWREAERPLHAVFSGARLLSPRVKRFADLVAERWNARTVGGLVL